MLIVKVLGTGCVNCKRVEQITLRVLQNQGIDAEVIKITEYPEIMKYNILSTPGLVINEKLVSSGRIPSDEEVKIWLLSAQN